jgi:hypothetical protein
MEKKSYRPKVGDKVTDSDGDIGVVVEAKDIHNIFVKFPDKSGRIGQGFFCLSRSKKCRRPHPLGHYDPLFPLDGKRAGIAEALGATRVIKKSVPFPFYRKENQ